MCNRSIIILAGGRQTRWGNCGLGCECKHRVLVPWDPGDLHSRQLPLIDRTLSMIQQWNNSAVAHLGYNVDLVVSVRPQPFENHPGLVSWWSPECRGGWGDAAVETILEMEVRNRRLVLMLGDVYWTWQSFRALLETETFVGVATDDCDTFGLSFSNDTTPIIADAIRAGGHKPGTIQRELRKVLGDFGRIECADWTQDFDIDWEHTQFLAGLSKNNLFRNTPDQVRRRRALGMRPQKSGRGRRTR